VPGSVCPGEGLVPLAAPARVAAPVLAVVVVTHHGVTQYAA
jgi:hypothetical protein